MNEITEVAGFGVALDRAYDPAGHFWVSMMGSERARIGMDALGVETSGTIAQLAFLPIGENLKRGEAFGSLEAAKFVGPLTSPLSGTVTATNDAVVVDPALVERDPYGDGWLVELTLADPGELGELISGVEAIPAWFAAEVEDYRLKGVLAE
ncbi:MAG TPA: glycine cleavage system protein H [Acidimicrobiia bacterium]|jgi:glycine cleavage system H protein|nr:glycine cleavage system protein H [Acidimicrobiia bacterium]